LKLQRLITEWSLFIIMDYGVWFIVKDGSASLHLLIPYIHDVFGLILIQGHTSAHCLILPVFPCLC